MLEVLRDKKVIFFDIGYTLDFLAASATSGASAETVVLTSSAIFYSFLSLTCCFWLCTTDRDRLALTRTCVRAGTLAVDW